MLQTGPALLTTYRVRLRGELDAERLLDGPTIVEVHDGTTILATADPDAERKLRSMDGLATIERIGRAILVSEQL
jgi:hypothetical protein